MRLNFQVRLYPNKTMKTILDSLCDYRRYCWNQGLELWNTLYDARLIGLSAELRAKIKESLTDKTIEFSEEEQALRAIFPAPSLLNVVLAAVTLKQVVRKSHSVEIENMGLNITNMFVTTAVMKMTEIIMQY